MSSRIDLIATLPNELILEIALYLDTESSGFFSSTSVAVHRLLSSNELWMKCVHRDLTRKPDLRPEESYQAFYRRMFREWSKFNISRNNVYSEKNDKIIFAFSKGLECLAQCVLDKKDMDSVRDNFLSGLIGEHKASHPGMSKILFDFIERLPSIDENNKIQTIFKERFIIEWLINQNYVAVTNYDKSLITSFFERLPLSVIVENMKGQMHPEGLRFSLFIKYVVLNDSQINDYILHDFSIDKKLSYIEVTLLSLLSNTFLVSQTHRLQAISSLLQLLPENKRTLFVRRFFENYPELIAELANFTQVNNFDNLSLDYLTHPLALQWYLATQIGYRLEELTQAIEKELDEDVDAFLEVALISGGKALSWFEERIKINGSIEKFYGLRLCRLLIKQFDKSMLANFFSLSSVSSRLESILQVCFSLTPMYHVLAHVDGLEAVINAKNDFPALPWHSIISEQYPHFMHNLNYFYLELLKETLRRNFSNLNAEDEDKLPVYLKRTSYSFDIEKFMIVSSECLLANKTQLFVGAANKLLSAYYMRDILRAVQMYDTVNGTRIFSALLKYSLVDCSELREFLCYMNHNAKYSVIFALRDNPEYFFKAYNDKPLPSEILKFIGKLRKDFSDVDLSRLCLGSYNYDGAKFIGAKLDWIKLVDAKSFDKAIFIAEVEWRDLDFLKQRIIRLYENQYPETLKLLSRAILKNILDYASNEKDQAYAIRALEQVYPLFGKRRSIHTASVVVNSFAGFFNQTVSLHDKTAAFTTKEQRAIGALMLEIESQKEVKCKLTEAAMESSRYA